LSLKNRTQQQKHTNEIRQILKDQKQNLTQSCEKECKKLPTNCEKDEAHLRAQTLRMGLPFFTTIQIQDTIAETSRV
jgi:hypothetical protein